MDIKNTVAFLSSYDGPELRFMEVCGTHTASISKSGIPSILSDKIKLISGPGCPVCVTPSSYIDKLCELAKAPDTCVVTFGDLIKVPSSKTSLAQVKSEGGKVHMVYSPFEIFDLAESHPGTNFVFACVGFETTTPIYALLLEKITEKNIKNIKLLTSLKTMPNAIDRLCCDGIKVDGFLAPGNVSVITGSDAFKPLAEKYSLPFVVSGFKAEELLASIYALVKLNNQGKVLNLYSYAVSDKGNNNAHTLVEKYFESDAAYWRGMGKIDSSALVLKEEYSQYDAGSRGLYEDEKFNNACRCSEVITGKLEPTNCPLYKKICTPQNPQGACMVSFEGSCFNYYIGNRG